MEGGDGRKETTAAARAQKEAAAAAGISVRESLQHAWASFLGLVETRFWLGTLLCEVCSASAFDLWGVCGFAGEEGDGEERGGGGGGGHEGGQDAGGGHRRGGGQEEAARRLTAAAWPQRRSSVLLSRSCFVQVACNI